MNNNKNLVYGLFGLNITRCKCQILEEHCIYDCAAYWADVCKIKAEDKIYYILGVHTEYPYTKHRGIFEITEQEYNKLKENGITREELNSVADKYKRGRIIGIRKNWKTGEYWILFGNNEKMYNFRFRVYRYYKLCNKWEKLIRTGFFNSYKECMEYIGDVAYDDKYEIRHIDNNGKEVLLETLIGGWAK